MGGRYPENRTETRVTTQARARPGLASGTLAGYAPLTRVATTKKGTQ